MAGFGADLSWEAVRGSGKIRSKGREESVVGKEIDLNQKEQQSHPYCTVARQRYQTPICTSKARLSFGSQGGKEVKRVTLS